MQEKENCFLFSVIMSVYQVKEYLEEAVNSLISQTIGFDKIQLILVDDGSTDGSGEICDEYQRKYPSQVKVIHKENGGLSSARNAGLPYADGKYISFFDPDDILGQDTLKEVCSYFDNNEEINICCVPMTLFGDRHGEHLLNYKFKKGTRTVDLLRDEDADCVLLHATSSFFRAQTARSMHFDSRMYHAEDSREIMKILISKPKYGVVASASYFYRRHSDSIIGKKNTNPRSYIEYLRYFSEWALNTAEEKYGHIPRFVQYTVMSDLQWRIRQGKIPDEALSAEKKDEYKELLYSIIRRIDVNVILQQRNLSKPQTLFVLSKKYGCMPDLCPHDGRNQDTDICYGGKIITKVSKMPTGLEFISIDEKGRCILEGYHIIHYGIKKEETAPFIIVNGKAYPCEKIDRSRNVDYALGEEIAWRIGFRATIPLSSRGSVTICPAVRIRQTTIVRKVTSYGQFFPVSSVYKHMRAYKSGYMLKMKNGKLIISGQPAWARRFAHESLLLAEIFRKNPQGRMEAIWGRVYYHVAKQFKRRQLWILSDRIMKADDNGEALFIYLMKNRPSRTRVVFAISRKSKDFQRIARIGSCIDAMSFRHKMLHLLCDVNMSAQAEGVTVNPLLKQNEEFRDLLSHQHYIFLQHGVTENDLSGWLNRYNKNISGFVAAAYPEYQSLLSPDYSYSPDQIWLTGFPRFDSLYHQEEKKITLMPTWRRWFMGELDNKTGTWHLTQDITNTDYYQFYHSLLTSDRLLHALEEYGYKLQFFPHPNIRLSAIEFDHDPRVAVLPTEMFYRDIYAESKLVITDYSSAAFDFAYLRKPVLYCQFDKDVFFTEKHVCTKGYFDFERDGFGEVTYNLESTIDQIIEYVSHDCELKEKYLKRIDNFFAFNDHDNCRRVTEMILQLKPRQ